MQELHDGGRELFRFAAFVSYSSKDSEFAKNLHSTLESYRIPPKLGTFDPIGMGKKNRIYPVFLDVDELPSGELSKGLESALRQSYALVVVCSADSAQSQWVNREIQYFESLGRSNRIFCIMLDGTTKSNEFGEEELSCLPKQLSPAYRKQQGLSSLDILVSDARPATRSLRKAYLKIIAGIIGVNLSQLYDRDREKVFRKRFSVSCLLLIIFIGIGVPSYFEFSNQLAELRTKLLARSEQHLNDRKLSSASFYLSLTGDSSLFPISLSQQVQRDALKLRLLTQKQFQYLEKPIFLESVVRCDLSTRWYIDGVKAEYFLDESVEEKIKDIEVVACNEQYDLLNENDFRLDPKFIVRGVTSDNDDEQFVIELSEFKKIRTDVEITDQEYFRENGEINYPIFSWLKFQRFDLSENGEHFLVVLSGEITSALIVVNTRTKKTLWKIFEQGVVDAKFSVKDEKIWVLTGGISPRTGMNMLDSSRAPNAEALRSAIQMWDLELSKQLWHRQINEYYSLGGLYSQHFQEKDKAPTLLENVDGSLIAIQGRSAFIGGEAKLFSTRDKRLVNWPGMIGISSIAFAPFKPQMVVSDGQTTQIWNTQDKVLTHEYDFAFFKAQFSRTDDTITFVNKELGALKLDFGQDKQQFRSIPKELDGIWVLAPGNNTVLVDSKAGVYHGQFETKLQKTMVNDVEILSDVSRNLTSLKIKLPDAQVIDIPHGSPITSFLITNDNQWVALLSSNSVVSIWNINKQEFEFQGETPFENASIIHFEPQSMSLVVAVDAQLQDSIYASNLYFFDLIKQENTVALEGVYKYEIEPNKRHFLGFDKNEALVVELGNSTVNRFDLPKPYRVGIFNDIKFSKNGKIAIYDSDEFTIMVDLERKRVIFLNYRVFWGHWLEHLDRFLVDDTYNNLRLIDREGKYHTLPGTDKVELTDWAGNQVSTSEILLPLEDGRVGIYDIKKQAFVVFFHIPTSLRLSPEDVDSWYDIFDNTDFIWHPQENKGIFRGPLGQILIFNRDSSSPVAMAYDSRGNAREISLQENGEITLGDFSRSVSDASLTQVKDMFKFTCKVYASLKEKDVIEYDAIMNSSQIKKLFLGYTSCQ